MSGAVEPLGSVPEEPRGTARHVRGGETRRRASKTLLLRGCALGRVTFALTAWKRLPYALAYYKKQIYGLSNERRKEKKTKPLPMPEPGEVPGSPGCSNAGGTRVLVCDRCHVPAVQRLNLSCRSLNLNEPRISKCRQVT